MHAPLIQAIAAQALANSNVFESQHLAGMLWSFAKLIFLNQTLIDALASEALAKISELSPQSLSQTAWSFATITVAPLGPLLQSISKQSLNKLREFSSQNMSLTVWSFARLLVRDDPLFDAIAAASLPILSAYRS